MELIVIFAPR